MIVYNFNYNREESFPPHCRISSKDYLIFYYDRSDEILKPFQSACCKNTQDETQNMKYVYMFSPEATIYYDIYET